MLLKGPACAGLERSGSRPLQQHLIAVAAFHIAQEALANAAKHAAATRLKVTVKWVDGEIILQIVDNGQGFLLVDTERQIGHGLANIELRARSVGGRVEVSSAPGEGTSVSAYLPVSRHVG